MEFRRFFVGDLALLGLAVVSVSTAAILVRLSGVHGFAAATWRLLLGSLLTLLLGFAASSGWRRSFAGLARREWLLLVASGIALALHFDLWMLSLSYTSVAVSVVVVDSYPALLAVVGRLFFGEKYAEMQIAGAFTAMLGVAGLSFYSSRGEINSGSFVGVLLALGGMVAVAAYFSIGKALRRKMSTWSYTLVVYSVGGVASLVFSNLVGARLCGYRVDQYFYLVLLAIVPMLGGHSVLNYLLKKMSLLAVTVPVLGEPVGASILAWLVLGEPLDAATVFLMGVVLLGIGLTVYSEAARL